MATSAFVTSQLWRFHLNFCLLNLYEKEFSSNALQVFWPWIDGPFRFSKHDRSQCKATPAFFSMRHFGHFSIKHFGHLSHCCMKFAATVFISLHLQTSWPKSPNFFGRFKNILVCDRKKENNSNHRCAAANRGWICCAWFLISALLSKLHLKALVFLYAFRGISRLPLQSVCYGFERVLRNFDCSLEFVFSLLLLQPFNFSPVSFACNFQDWGCVILHEIDFYLKICWWIPCLHPSWKVHTCAKTLCSSPNRSGVNCYVRVWNTQCLQLNGTIYQCSYSTRKKLCSFESTKQRTYSDHRLHVFPWVCFAAWDDSVEQVMVSDMLWYGIYSAVINVFYNSRK